MNTTEKLKLQKYDPINDLKQPFSIEKALNENWNIIDEKLGSIATEEFINKTGDTFTGVLTYTGEDSRPLVLNTKDAITYTGINVVNSFANNTKTPSQQENFMVLDSLDSNNQVVGEILTKHQTNGTMRTVMRANKTINNAVKTSEISVSVDTSGNVYASAPSSAISGSICTTQNISKSSNGYMQLGNGLIICWGASSTSSAKVDTTVTFAKSFNSTPRVILSRSSASNTTQETTAWLRSTSTTNFKWYTSPTLTGITYIAIGY